MARQPVTPEDLITSGVAVRDALAQLSEAQWHEKPPRMDWTRFITGMHICQALGAYAANLALAERMRKPLIPVDEDRAKSAVVPELVRGQAVLLASVARGVPPDTRGWHSTGLPDIEGFLAMGCAEVLLHCWDAAQDTDISFAGDESVADHVLQRLFPWAPTDTPRWQTLLFATGRGELEGHESPGERWMWQNAPLDEWDGTEPRSDAWVRKK